MDALTPAIKNLFYSTRADLGPEISDSDSVNKQRVSRGNRRSFGIDMEHQIRIIAD